MVHAAIYFLLCNSALFHLIIPEKEEVLDSRFEASSPDKTNHHHPISSFTHTGPIIVNSTPHSKRYYTKCLGRMNHKPRTKEELFLSIGELEFCLGMLCVDPYSSDQGQHDAYTPFRSVFIGLLRQ